MTADQFLATPKGARFDGLVRSPDVIARMIAHSRTGRTAIEAIDPLVADAIGPMTDDEKTAAGRVVKAALREHGWVPWKKNGRVRNGRVFSRGSIYREITPPVLPPPAPSPDGAGADRYQAAIDILRASRQGAAPTDGVDAFLAERRAMWGGA